MLGRLGSVGLLVAQVFVMSLTYYSTKQKTVYQWYTTVVWSALQSSNCKIECCCLFVCLLLNGTSALFRPLVPRIVEIEHTNHVKNDLK